MEADRRAAIRARLAVIRAACARCVPDDPPWREIDEALAYLDELLPPPHPTLIGDPLTSDLLDLIRLMPDHQVDAIITFVIGLRAARGTGRRVTMEPPTDAPGAWRG
jgi:hypothetical protein